MIEYTKEQRELEKENPHMHSSNSELADWMAIQYLDIDTSKECNSDILTLLKSLHKMSTNEIKRNLIEIMQINT